MTSHWLASTDLVYNSLTLTATGKEERMELWLEATSETITIQVVQVIREIVAVFLINRLTQRQMCLTSYWSKDDSALWYWCTKYTIEKYVSITNHTCNIFGLSSNQEYILISGALSQYSSPLYLAGDIKILLNTIIQFVRLQNLQYPSFPYRWHERNFKSIISNTFIGL